MTIIDLRRASKLPAYRLQVLERALLLLDTLAEADGDLALNELTERLALHKSTIHRLLMVLEHYRLIRRSPNSGYSLGVKLYALGTRAIAQIRLRDRAELILRFLVDQTRESAHVCILDGNETLTIAHVEAPWVVRIPSTIGRRTPVHCTSVGKVLSAFLPDSARTDLVGRLQLTRYTEHTLVTRSALGAELIRVCKQGYATDNEEREIGLRCVGVPIRDYSGRVMAAMSVAGPAFRVTKERIPELVKVMLIAAADLSASLGYTSTEQLNESTSHKSVGSIAREKLGHIPSGSKRRKERWASGV